MAEGNGGGWQETACSDRPLAGRPRADGERETSCQGAHRRASRSPLAFREYTRHNLPPGLSSPSARRLPLMVSVGAGLPHVLAAATTRLGRVRVLSRRDRSASEHCIGASTPRSFVKLLVIAQDLQGADAIRRRSPSHRRHAGVRPLSCAALNVCVTCLQPASTRLGLSGGQRLDHFSCEHVSKVLFNALRLVCSTASIP